MTATDRITGIILAAGMSKRLGKPKQLLKIGGEFIINRVVDTALESHLDTVVLILGHRHADILPVLGDRLKTPNLKVEINRDYRKGMSQSLRCGVLSVKSRYDAIMFLLGDQPLLDSETIDHLIEQYRSSDKPICVPLCRGERKNPTLFSSRYYDSLLNIQGDTGARAIIKNQPEDVLFVEINRPELFLDVDTPGDLQKAEALFNAHSMSLT
ncbi:MAG: nucleotidyltransferase family protein [Deltaproteobacteria bacterium]|nr:nucleotidyltransferase family protein [Deltaproteobacteria bacterium]